MTAVAIRTPLPLILLSALALAAGSTRLAAQARPGGGAAGGGVVVGPGAGAGGITVTLPPGVTPTNPGTGNAGTPVLRIVTDTGILVGDTVQATVAGITVAAAAPGG